MTSNYETKQSELTYGKARHFIQYSMPSLKVKKECERVAVLTIDCS
jgi:hypothetical protein